MSVNNPFYHRGAIREAESFFGRESVSAETLGLLRNGQSVSIIGPRRIGKSSLLLHLCRPAAREAYDLAPPNALFVLVDCQELGGSPAEEVYAALHDGLVDAADSAEIPLKQAEQVGTYRALDRALNQVVNAGTKVVVLLDEFELLAANEHLTPYFFARLRGLTTKYGLAFITASQRPLYAITADEKILSSPFFNIFVTLSLSMFSEDEANGLYDQRLNGTPIVFDEPLRTHLFQLVGHHPFFLHVAGYHAFQLLAGEEDVSAETLNAEIDASAEIESESHLSYLWGNLTHDEQYALATLESPVDIQRMLEQQCLIQRSDDCYAYTSSILERFVRRQTVAGIIQAGPFVIDPQRHQVKAFGELLALTNSQFALMTCLGERFGQVVRGEQLEVAVWGEVLIDDPDRLKTLIKRLRRAIEPYNDWVVSERGVGYALRAPE